MYDQCRAEPSAWGEGSQRRGTVGPFGFVEDRTTPDDKAFVATITRKHCLDFVEVSGFGRSFRGGPFLPMSDSAFVSSAGAKRLAVAHSTEDGASWVWLDGTQFGPYERLDLHPRFSNDGRHVAWAAMDGSEQVLFVDGREARRGERLIEAPFFWVLDSGKVAAALLRSDDKKQILVGEYDSGPLDELCDSSGFSVGPRGRWAYAARRGETWSTVVDGRETRIEGVPLGCRVEFTRDGTRYGYVAMPGARGSRVPPKLVLDGRVTPLEDGVTSFWFDGQLPLVRSSRQTGPSLNAWEHKTIVLETPTPREAPSVDEYQPEAGYGGGTWERVQIGESVGPKFDRIEKLERDASGRVRYVGVRRQGSVEVIDNVIVVPSPTRRGPAIAE